ncbi:hypothetical protein BJY04DRAFT_104058 [Aspergillus karnatakaensis]|uniref:uncharacterized protein n=1 Tax=Aspergillus karnatakaensis TaxID=1810916 RepID=UPI003CCE3AF8
MSPDINSLPPSRSTSASPRQRRNLSSLLDTLAPTIPTQSISSSGVSSTTSPSMSSNNNNNNNNNNNHPNGSNMTTDLPRRHHPIAVSERRRSGNLNLNSGNNSYSESGIGEMPSPSEHRSSFGHGLRTSSPSNLGGSPIIGTGDPHHQRAPSLGELHQELEQEQEAQVNRLLQTIRSQQARLQHLEQQHHQQSAIDDATPSSERSTSFPPAAALSNAGSRTSTQLPSSLSSRRPSQVHSPSLRPIDPYPDTLEWIPGPGEGLARRGSRGESSFYQAEATTLARENQMLRLRIRELERQVSDLSTNASTQGLSATSSGPQTLGAPAVGDPQAATTGGGSDGELSDKT